MSTRKLFTFAALLGATLAAPAAPASADDGSNPAPAIGTYNVFLMSRNLYPNWGQDQRVDLLADDGVLAGQDVVVLNEAFDNGSSDRLLDALSEEYPHRTPVVGRSRSGWDATTGFRDEAAEDGGVAVASVWPITRREQHLFTDACGGDWFSSKGFAYARLATPDGPLHVVGTHLQSDDDGCAGDLEVDVRWSQLDQIRSFVEGLPADEPVYVAGDLNVARGGAEYASMLGQLDAVRPRYAGAEFSFDPATNSVAAARYGDLPGQQLDHVLPIANDAAPDRYTNTTEDAHSEPWTVSAGGRDYTYTDYSDHYPVFGGAG